MVDDLYRNKLLKAEPFSPSPPSQCHAPVAGLKPLTSGMARQAFYHCANLNCQIYNRILLVTYIDFKLIRRNLYGCSLCLSFSLSQSLSLSVSLSLSLSLSQSPSLSFCLSFFLLLSLSPCLSLSLFLYLFIPFFLLTFNLLL